MNIQQQVPAQHWGSYMVFSNGIGQGTWILSSRWPQYRWVNMSRKKWWDSGCYCSPIKHSSSLSCHSASQASLHISLQHMTNKPLNFEPFTSRTWQYWPHLFQQLLTESPISTYVQPHIVQSASSWAKYLGLFVWQDVQFSSWATCSCWLSATQCWAGRTQWSCISLWAGRCCRKSETSWHCCGLLDKTVQS